jgi:hypothetical protein
MHTELSQGDLLLKKVKMGHSNRYERDLSNGIFHVSTGLDRGLTKSMEFGLSNQKYLREARYEQSDFKPELQLSDVYNANINMYGNNLFSQAHRSMLTQEVWAPTH